MDQFGFIIATVLGVTARKADQTDGMFRQPGHLDQLRAGKSRERRRMVAHLSDRAH